MRFIQTFLASVLAFVTISNVEFQPVIAAESIVRDATTGCLPGQKPWLTGKMVFGSTPIEATFTTRFLANENPATLNLGALWMDNAGKSNSSGDYSVCPPANSDYDPGFSFPITEIVANSSIQVVAHPKNNPGRSYFLVKLLSEQDVDCLTGSVTCVMNFIFSEKKSVTINYRLPGNNLPAQDVSWSLNTFGGGGEGLFDLTGKFSNQGTAEIYGLPKWENYTFQVRPGPNSEKSVVAKNVAFQILDNLEAAPVRPDIADPLAEVIGANSEFNLIGTTEILTEFGFKRASGTLLTPTESPRWLSLARVVKNNSNFAADPSCKYVPGTYNVPEGCHYWGEITGSTFKAKIEDGFYAGLFEPSLTASYSPATTGYVFKVTAGEISDLHQIISIDGDLRPTSWQQKLYYPGSVQSFSIIATALDGVTVSNGAAFLPISEIPERHNFSILTSTDEIPLKPEALQVTTNCLSGSCNNSDYYSVRTDKGNRFAYDYLPNGNYLLNVSVSSFTKAKLASTEFTLEVTNSNSVIRKQGVVQDKNQLVLDSSNVSGKILGVSGEKLRTEITIQDSNGRTIDNALAITSHAIERSGIFYVNKKLENGQYKLVFTPSTYTGSTPLNNSWVAKTISIVNGQVVEDLSNLTFSYPNVAGESITVTGDPLPWSSINIEKYDGSSYQSIPWGAPDGAPGYLYSNAQGRFASKFEPGIYRLTLNPNGGGSAAFSAPSRYEIAIDSTNGFCLYKDYNGSTCASGKYLSSLSMQPGKPQVTGILKANGDPVSNINLSVSKMDSIGNFNYSNSAYANADYSSNSGRYAAAFTESGIYRIQATLNPWSNVPDGFSTTSAYFKAELVNGAIKVCRIANKNDALVEPAPCLNSSVLAVEMTSDIDLTPANFMIHVNDESTAQRSSISGFIGSDNGGSEWIWTQTNGEGNAFFNLPTESNSYKQSQFNIRPENPDYVSSVKTLCSRKLPSSTFIGLGTGSSCNLVSVLPQNSAGQSRLDVTVNSGNISGRIELVGGVPLDGYLPSPRVQKLKYIGTGAESSADPNANLWNWDYQSYDWTPLNGRNFKFDLDPGIYRLTADPYSSVNYVRTSLLIKVNPETRTWCQISGPSSDDSAFAYSLIDTACIGVLGDNLLGDSFTGLSFTLQQPNFIGQLQDSQGNPIKYSGVSAYWTTQKNVNGSTTFVNQHAYRATNETGKFSLQLDKSDGRIYNFDFWPSGSLQQAPRFKSDISVTCPQIIDCSFAANENVTISNGVFIFKAPSPNLLGKVCLPSAGESLCKAAAGAQIEVKKQSGLDWQWTNNNSATNSKGHFSLLLEKPTSESTSRYKLLISSPWDSANRVTTEILVNVDSSGVASYLNDADLSTPEVLDVNLPFPNLSGNLSYLIEGATFAAKGGWYQVLYEGTHITSGPVSSRGKYSVFLPSGANGSEKIYDVWFYPNWSTLQRSPVHMLATVSGATPLVTNWRYFGFTPTSTFAPGDASFDAVPANVVIQLSNAKKHVVLVYRSGTELPQYASLSSGVANNNKVYLSLPAGNDYRFKVLPSYPDLTVITNDIDVSTGSPESPTLVDIEVP